MGPAGTQQPPAYAVVTAAIEDVKQRGEQLLAMLPTHADKARFIGMIAAELGRKREELAKCRKATIIDSVILAARTGLEVGGSFAQAHFVVFGDECTLMADYRGLVFLGFRSGALRSVTANIVRENDIFEASESGVIHRYAPLDSETERGAPIGCYARLELSTGAIQWEVMSKEEIYKARAASKSFNRNPNKSPWTHWEMEMWKKTVLRRGLKKVPLQGDVSRALSDLDAEENENVRPDAPARPLGLDGLASRFEDAPEPAEHPANREAPDMERQEVLELIDKAADPGEKDLPAWREHVLLTFGIAAEREITPQTGNLIRATLNDEKKLNALRFQFYEGGK